MLFRKTYFLPSQFLYSKDLLLLNFSIYMYLICCNLFPIPRDGRIFYVIYRKIFLWIRRCTYWKIDDNYFFVPSFLISPLLFVPWLLQRSSYSRDSNHFRSSKENVSIFVKKVSLNINIKSHKYLVEPSPFITPSAGSSSQQPSLLSTFSSYLPTERSDCLRGP